MRFPTNTAILGLFVTLFVYQFQSIYSAVLNIKPETKKKMGEEAGKVAAQTTMDGLVTAIIPAVAVVAPPPAGPLLAVGLGLIYNIIRSSPSEKPDLDLELLIANKTKAIEQSMARGFNALYKNLGFISEAHPFLRAIREELQILETDHDNNIISILDAQNTGPLKKQKVDKMLDSTNEYRKSLRSFTLRYIGTHGGALQDLHADKFYYHFIKQKWENERKENIDCHSKSYHTRIFDAYLYIAGVLTKSYSMIAAAHATEYQRYLSLKKPSDAKDIKDNLETAIKEYIGQMGVLMSETKWAMKDSPKEIQMCGPTHLVEGTNYDTFNFYETRIQLRVGGFFGGCSEHNKYWKYNNDNFDLLNCQELDNDKIYNIYSRKRNNEEYIPDHLSRVEISGRQYYGSLSDWERAEKKWGREDPHIFYHEERFTAASSLSCPLRLCNAIRKNSRVVKISTRLVEAQPGYVITGLRWRLRNDIFFIDIQQGKFIDETKVDSSTVHWKETEQDGNLVTLDEKIRLMVLTDVTLPIQTYVTGVQLRIVSGAISFSVVGKKVSKDGKDLSPQTSQYRPDDTYEKEDRLTLNMEKNNDDPKLAPENSVNIVMREQSKYFVKFQATDLEKDFGKNTIPFIDIQEVFTNPSAPIGGLGIYHKTLPGYGGFVALRMLAPDLSHMIDEQRFKTFATTLAIA